MYTVQEPDLARGLNVFNGLTKHSKNPLHLMSQLPAIVSAIVSGICLCVLKNLLKQFKFQ